MQKNLQSDLLLQVIGMSRRSDGGTQGLPIGRGGGEGKGGDGGEAIVEVRTISRTS
jgi:hypothetical protein